MDAVGHDCFKCLSRLRNSIVHRAARCDTEFKKDAQELEGLAKWKDLEIGDLLIFTGGDVQRLLDPVVEQSVALIKSVAEWIDRH